MGLVGSSSIDDDAPVSHTIRTNTTKARSRVASAKPIELWRKSLNLKLVRKERFELSRSCERQPLKLVENLL